MRWASASAVILALLIATPAHAQPSPDPARAVVFPVEDLVFPNGDLVLPHATLDGSVLTEGNRVTLASDVFFAYNDATLTGRARDELQRLAEGLRESKDAPVVVVGHTDSDGPAASNERLSLRRAEAVASYVSELVPGIAITASGRGETEPVASNDTPEGRALNRRVTITFG